MTSTGKIVRDKYHDIIDKVAARKLLLSDNSNENYIRADIAKSLIAQAIEEYERKHDAPRVDFWGQPIGEE